MQSVFELAFSGSGFLAILKRLHALGLPKAGPPDKLRCDAKERKVTEDWVDRWAPKCKFDIMAFWEDAGWLRLDRDTIVKVSMEEYPIETQSVLELVQDIPFTIGSNSSLYPEWRDGTLGEKYLAPGFADLHWSHGWACFFKGDGHRRLVSRRWLDFGPWRVVRGANDTTMVQFHDFEADAKTALEQAKPGHERMGISRNRNGGFLQTGYVYRHELEGRYFAQTRKLDIVVNGREVTQSEMLDACAARHYQALGPDQPLDNVAYTFVVEEEARAHLHELWLRELECWAIIKGREVRLDLDYHPTPTPPDWVRHVEAREGGAT